MKNAFLSLKKGLLSLVCALTVIAALFGFAACVPTENTPENMGGGWLF